MRQRLAPALEVFKTLQRYPVLRPRRIYRVPIGNIHEHKWTEPLLRKDFERCLHHLYHDLGVLVFAGCSVSQTRRIGDILQQVTQWGGIGGSVSRSYGDVDDAHARQRRPAPKSFAVHATVEQHRAGRLRAETLWVYASAQLQEMLHDRFARHYPELRHKEIQETAVLIPNWPPVRSSRYYTVDGFRPLTITSLASINGDQAHGLIKGIVRFYTVGTEDYVGSVRIEYIVYASQEQGPGSLPVFQPSGKYKLDSTGDEKEQRLAMKAVVSTILEPLWELESEIWAGGAREISGQVEPA